MSKAYAVMQIKRGILKMHGMGERHRQKGRDTETETEVRDRESKDGLNREEKAKEAKHAIQ